MLIHLENTQMGSQSKVKAMLEKFEQLEHPEAVKLCPQVAVTTQIKPQSTPKMKSPCEVDLNNSVTKRRLLFQKAENSKTPTAATIPASRQNFQTEAKLEVTKNASSLSPTFADKKDIKNSKLRRSIPVNARKSITKSKSADSAKKFPSFPSIVRHKTMGEDFNFISAAGVKVEDSLRKNKPITELGEGLHEGKSEKLTSLPLPSGKPPAKPPRTFEHDTYIALKTKLNKTDQSEPFYATIPEESTSKQVVCPPEKTCLPNIPPPNNLPNGKSVKKDLKQSEKEKKTIRKLEPYAVTDIYKDGRNSKINFEMVPKRPRSQFFVDDINVDDSANSLKRCFSNERVYDEPFSGNGSLKSFNSDETLVMNNVIYDRIHCENRNDDDGLHYWSSPVLKNHGFNFLVNKKPSFTSWQKPPKKVQGFSRNIAKRRESVRDLVNQSFSRKSRSFSTADECSSSNVPDDEESGDSDNEVTAREVEKRIIYMRTVSRAASVKLGRPRLSDPADPRVFNCVLVVGLRNSVNDVGYDPYVKISYPEDYTNADAKECPALQFCFPDAEFWKPSQTGETFTFVMTNSRGERTYGYCRRIKPDHSPVSLPIVYCVLSSVLSFSFYVKILIELEYRHGSPDAEIKTFLDTLYQNRLPSPGKSIKMPTCRWDTKEEIHRPQDTTVDDLGIDCLVKALDVTNLLKIFASLLLERRVVLYSSSLGVVSRCVQAFQALLYPYIWQHTFIPILPPEAIDVIGSPTPFLIGMLSHFVSQLQDIPMEQSDVLMVDLDHNRLFQEVGDELQVLPKKMQKALNIALKMAKTSPDVSLLTVEAFLRMFVETTGHYSNFIVTQQDGQKTFERELFCTATQSHGIASFLQWFTETQMFSVFIDSQIEGTTLSYTPFDRRIEEFRNEVDNSSQSIRGNFKDFGKKVKTLGERLIGLKTPEKN